MGLTFFLTLFVATALILVASLMLGSSFMGGIERLEQGAWLSRSSPAW
jgi:hypothetical protein